MTFSIDRRANLDVSTFVNEYLRPLRPVVIEGALDAWPARRWSPEYLKQRWGHKEVMVEDKPRLLGEYLEELLAAPAERPAPYLRNLDIPTRFPELMADLQPTIPFCRPDRLHSKLFPRNFPQTSHFLDLFIGGPGAGFPTMHYDVHHLVAYIAQLYGEKDFFIYPPDQTPYLYPSDPPDESLVGDPTNVDLTKFPEFAKARGVRITLGPGDLLFNPCGFWHTTKIKSVSIGVGWDQLCAFNWREFMGDQYDRRRTRPLKALGVLSYLMAAGAVMSVTEKLRGLPTQIDLRVDQQIREAIQFQR